MQAAFDELADSLAAFRQALREATYQQTRPLLDWIERHEGLALSVLVFLYTVFLAAWGWIAYRTGQPWWLAGAPVHFAAGLLLAARLNR